MYKHFNTLEESLLIKTNEDKSISFYEPESKQYKYYFRKHKILKIMKSERRQKIMKIL